MSACGTGFFQLSAFSGPVLAQQEAQALDAINTNMENLQFPTYNFTFNPGEHQPSGTMNMTVVPDRYLHLPMQPTEQTKHKNITFNLKTESYIDLFKQIKMYPDHKFIFNTLYDKLVSLPLDRCHTCYHTIFTDFTNNILTRINAHFVDINMDHTFWHDDDNIKIFVLFVKMSLQSAYVLPFHF